MAEEYSDKADKEDTADIEADIADNLEGIAGNLGDTVAVEGDTAVEVDTAEVDTVVAVVDTAEDIADYMKKEVYIVDILDCLKKDNFAKRNSWNMVDLTNHSLC